jgi:ketosteroid isomerase-like protein
VGTQENRQLIERWYHALEAMDFETLESLHADDVVYNLVGTTPVSGRWVGKEECFAEVINNKLMATLVVEESQFGKKWRIMCADENCVVGVMQGGGPTKNGDRYDQTYCEIFTIRDGKIAELHAFLDTVLVERCLNDNPLQKPETVPKRPFDF